MVSQAQQGPAACNVNLYYNLHLSCTAVARFHRLHKNKERTPECTGERRCDRVRSRVTAVAHAQLPRVHAVVLKEVTEIRVGEQSTEAFLAKPNKPKLNCSMSVFTPGPLRTQTQHTRT